MDGACADWGFHAISGNVVIGHAGIRPNRSGSPLFRVRPGAGTFIQYLEKVRGWMSPDIQPLLLPRSYRSTLFQSNPRMARCRPGCIRLQADCVPAADMSMSGLPVLRESSYFAIACIARSVTADKFAGAGARIRMSRFDGRHTPNSRFAIAAGEQLAAWRRK